MDVFGPIPSVEQGVNCPVSTYRLDNRQPHVVFNSTNISSNEAIPLYSFYQSPGDLVDGNHSLLIKSTEDQTLFILDFIVYGSRVSNSSTNATPSLSLTQLTPPSSPSSSQTTKAVASPPTSKLPIWGMVGGIIAASVVLVVVALIISYRRRRRSSSSDSSDPNHSLLREARDGEGILFSGHSTPQAPSFISLSLSPSELNVSSASEPSSSSAIWGSIPHSVSTTSTVFGDFSETSYINEKKEDQKLADSNHACYYCI